MSDNITSESLLRALTSEDSSVRFNAAMAAGTHPNSDFIETLVSRCAVEPDFFVRDMLTWALISHDRSVVTPRIIQELSSSTTQARSQALHTLSKIADPATWPVMSEQLLLDKEDDVARVAWRVAVILAPEDERRALAELLVTQLNRGDNAVKLSLSRALVDPVSSRQMPCRKQREAATKECEHML